ncbi:MAG TPA: DUF5689 domain-containing protein [Chitinophagaceae bacterium]|nr:DUF5689 domain-containing protein [Chitinophagaceae bacterium]
MKKIILSSFAILALMAITITSCVKQKFDSPPDASTVDPNIPVNNTILAIKNLYTGAPTLIDSDYVVSGIVTADDRTGCFYKQIVIQDSSSGIVILLGRNGLYTDYPVGRKIYVKCKGLYVGAYGGFVQLGYTPDITNSLSDIPSALISKHIIKANTGNPVTPLVVNVNDLKSFNTTSIKWLGTLIRIDSAQFKISEVGQPYAQDPNIASGTDRTIEDCVGKNIVVRMSGYATFRNEKIPAGKGPITAIYSRYNSTAQLLIRDTSDIDMRGPRCGGVVITPAIDITIDSLRKLHNASASVYAGAYKIHGVITSSRLDSSISKGNLFIQDESGKGIIVYFGQNEVGKVLGDSVVIELDSLVTYAGVIEAKASLSKMTKISGGKTVQPKVITLADLNADLNLTLPKDRKYESVLVQVANCTISGSPATYSGSNVADRSKTVTDPTGTIILYSQPTVPFKTTNYPTGIVTITAVASKFNTTNQLQIRKFTDVN